MRFRPDLAARSESSYRARTTRGVTWHQSLAVVDGLGVVVKRFPRVDQTQTDGRNYVLVHGLGVYSHYFEWLAAALARTADVWLIDLPGYGSAPKPSRDVSIVDHASVLAAVIESADVAAPVLVGHSMGCQVVTEIAARFPELTDSLVLLSPVVNPARRTAWKQFVNLVQDLFREPPRAALFGLYSYFLTGKSLYYLKQVPHMIEYRIEDRLPLVEARTLVAIGERDPLAPIEWASLAASIVPRGDLTVVPGAHVIMYSAPVILADRIREHVTA